MVTLPPVNLSAKMPRFQAHPADVRFGNKPVEQPDAKPRSEEEEMDEQQIEHLANSIRTGCAALFAVTVAALFCWAGGRTVKNGLVDLSVRQQENESTVATITRVPLAVSLGKAIDVVPDESNPERYHVRQGGREFGYFEGDQVYNANGLKIGHVDEEGNMFISSMPGRPIGRYGADGDIKLDLALAGRRMDIVDENDVLTPREEAAAALIMLDWVNFRDTGTNVRK